MDMLSEFEKVSNFYVCCSVRYMVKGPKPLQVAKASGWSRFVKGKKRMRFDISVFQYASGERELYRHVSGLKPVKMVNPTTADIFMAFEIVDAKTKKNVVVAKNNVHHNTEVYEQMTLF